MESRDVHNVDVVNTSLNYVQQENLQNSSNENLYVSVVPAGDGGLNTKNLWKWSNLDPTIAANDVKVLLHRMSALKKQ